MAGNTRRSSEVAPSRIGRTPPGLVRIGQRKLRVEQLEDRSVPAIIQQGIPNWLEAGPTPAINAQVSGIGDDPVTGSAEVLTPHPTDPNILFLAGTNGGVWRTTNALTEDPTWTALTDQMPSLSIASMAINQQNPNQLLVGHGGISSAFDSGDLIGAVYTENALDPTPAFRVIGGNIANMTHQAAILRTNYAVLAGNGGLFRSMDGVQTFQLLSGTGNLPAGPLTDAIFDPQTPNRVYIAGVNGVFRTDDITAPTPNWIDVTSPLMLLTGGTANIKLAIHATPTANVLYVATANPFTNGHSIATVVWSVNFGISFTAMDEPLNLAAPQGLTDATNAQPIQITSANHGLATGDRVRVEGVAGNLGANGIWTVTVTAANTFTLDNSVGTGNYINGSGSFRKIFGVAPGGQAELHFAITADPTDSNLLYLSGDRQDRPFTTNVGASNFTGNIMRGDRSKPRGFGALIPSPQWTAITNNLADGGGAPHADSRFLVFDSAGDLLEADDGGTYRRTIPQTSQGKWFSLNGNTGLAQFYKVQLDTVNNVIFGGTQDTGSVEQIDGSGPAGSSMWDTLGQGDGFWQGVDNTQKVGLGVSLRYSMQNTVEAFRRRTFDSSNNLISNEQVIMASPANPTKLFDGLDAADKGSFGNNVFTLNAFDGRLMMLGINKLYEDNDPDLTLGKAGDVIANITPQNFAGRVTSIVYGTPQTTGLSPEQSRRIAYIATSAGQLWIRGAVGGLTKNTTLPGAGGINQVVIDPDDYRTSYVLRNNQVFRSTDLGLTWVEITENLVGSGFDASGNVINGLTNSARSIAVWDPQPGTANGEEIILVGGTGGVFRYAPSIVDPECATGNWLEFGANLPNAIVTGVEVYGNRVVVGTLGRGAFVVPDVSTTIRDKAIVQIVGDATDNKLTMQADVSNPAFVIVSDGVSTLRVERSVVQGFEFKGLGGADNVLISANGFPAGDLNFIRFHIDVDGGGDVGDLLELRNFGRTTPTRVTITANTVGSDPLDNLISDDCAAALSYTGLQKGTLLLDLGADAPATNEIFIQSTTAGTTRVLGGKSTDDFHIGSTAGQDDLGILDNITGNVAIDGRSGALDTLTVSDFGATKGNVNITVGTDSIAGFAGPTDNTIIFFTNTANVVLSGSDSTVLPETFTLSDPNAVFTVQANDGPDTMNVRSNHLTTNLDGGLGNDLFRISSVAGLGNNGDLSQIKGTINVEGSLDDNRLIISDFTRATGSVVTVTSTNFTGATPNPINYTASGGRFFNGTAGDGIQYRGSNNAVDTFLVASTLADSQTAVDGNGGNDLYTVDGESLSGNVLLRGGADIDTFGVTPGVFGITSDSLRISGGDGLDFAGIVGFEVDDNVSITMFDNTNGQLAGVNKPVDFDTLEQLNFDGATGRNNLSIVDATNQKHGSLADPGAGIVYRPTTVTGGEVSIGRGAVGPLFVFENINGSDAKGFVINGDPSGTGKFEDTLTALGVSEPTVRSTFGETVATFGADNIFVSDTTVTFKNASLGFLRPVAIGRTAGNASIATLVVRGGNEITQGDTFNVLPSKEVDIFVDGGGPTKRSIGDILNVATTSPRTVQQVIDPVTGAQTRLVVEGGGSFGFRNFENTGGVQTSFAVGADAGGGPRVRVYDPLTSRLLFDGFVYDASFTGGVRVATGDVTGDGIPDLITGAGAGGGPHIQVFDGTDYTLIAGFFAYEPTFSGGVFVSLGDVNGDGVLEIIAGSGSGGGPLVRIFNQFGTDQGSFFAYDENFRGGVRAAAGDVDGDGIAEVITGAGVGGGPHVRIFNGMTLEPVGEFMALPEDFRNGIYVAAGDMDGDKLAEIVIGPGGDQAPELIIRRGSTGEFINISVFDIGQIADPLPLPSVGSNVLSASGSPSKAEQGIRVAMTDTDDTGKTVVIASRGPGYPSRVHTYSIDPAQELSNFLAFEGFDGGVFVG